MRTIDAEDLKKDIAENSIILEGVWAIEVECAKALIDNAPTVEERPKGKWITVNPLQDNDDGAFSCSCCKVGSWHWGNSYHFCPNCGAKMER